MYYSLGTSAPRYQQPQQAAPHSMWFVIKLLPAEPMIGALTGRLARRATNGESYLEEKRKEPLSDNTSPQRQRGVSLIKHKSDSIAVLCHPFSRP